MSTKDFTRLRKISRFEIMFNGFLFWIVKVGTVWIHDLGEEGGLGAS